MVSYMKYFVWCFLLILSLNKIHAKTNQNHLTQEKQLTIGLKSLGHGTLAILFAHNAYCHAKNFLYLKRLYNKVGSKKAAWWFIYNALSTFGLAYLSYKTGNKSFKYAQELFNSQK